MDTLSSLHSLRLLEQEILKKMELSGEHEEKYGERQTERQSKLQKLFCPQENCPDRVLSSVVLVLLVCGYAVLDKLLKYPNNHFCLSSCLSPLLTFLFPWSKP